jgi:hypothetical protein
MNPVATVSRQWFAEVGAKLRERYLAEHGRETPRIVCAICEDTGHAFWLHTEPYPHTTAGRCACVTKEPIPPNATCVREAYAWEASDQ